MAVIPATTHALAEGNLVWDSDGYYAFGDQSWKTITIKAKLTYKGGEIGLFPRFFSQEAYIGFKIGNYTVNTGGTPATATTSAVAQLYGQVFNDTVSLGKKEDLVPLVVDHTYTIKAEVTKDNFKIYLDTDLLFNVDYNTISIGMAAVYATSGNITLSIEAIGTLADGWISNIAEVSGATVELQKLENDDTYLYLDNPDGLKELKVWQDFNITSGGIHTLSFSYIGEVTARIISTTTTDLTREIECPFVADWTPFVYTIDLGTATHVKVIFVLKKIGFTKVNGVQFEKNPYRTDYIHNTSTTEVATRNFSYITYPAEGNISAEEGAVSLWIKPSATYNNALGQSVSLVTCGDGASPIQLYHENEQFSFTYGEITIYDSSSGVTALAKDTWHHIYASWSQMDTALYVNGVGTKQSGLFTVPATSDLIRIGHCIDASFSVFNGAMDDLIIYSKPLPEGEVLDLYQATELPETTKQMILRATFDHAIVGYEQSVIEMSPAPQYGSPVILKKANGSVMNKVSYSDPYTGDYRPYTMEPAIYDGKSDYIEVGSKKIEDEAFKIAVRDRYGAILGDPYRVEYNRIYLALSKTQKKDLRGQTLYATFQPIDAYTVDFNIGMPDSFRVNIGKHDGQGINVVYEGNRFSDEKLGTMIELNPLLNPAHEGFLYITQNAQGIASFRVKATPTDMYADGISDAVVVVEPLDANGNFVGNALLAVKANEGSMIPNYDPGSIKLRSVAGRYLYKYRAPLIKYTDRPAVEVVDYINIRDRDTGLGVQIPIILTVRDSYPNTNTVSLEQENWERVAAYILDKVMDYFGEDASKLPVGLGTLLDLNADGKIDLNEIIWLNNNKLNQALYDKYVAILGWYQSHA